MNFQGTTSISDTKGTNSLKRKSPPAANLSSNRGYDQPLQPGCSLGTYSSPLMIVQPGQPAGRTNETGRDDRYKRRVEEQSRRNQMNSLGMPNASPNDQTGFPQPAGPQGKKPRYVSLFPDQNNSLDPAADDDSLVLTDDDDDGVAPDGNTPAPTTSNATKVYAASQPLKLEDKKKLQDRKKEITKPNDNPISSYDGKEATASKKRMALFSEMDWPSITQQLPHEGDGESNSRDRKRNLDQKGDIGGQQSSIQSNKLLNPARFSQLSDTVQPMGASSFEGLSLPKFIKQESTASFGAAKPQTAADLQSLVTRPPFEAASRPVGPQSTAPQNLPSAPPAQVLSRHSISLFSDAEIKDLKEPFIDNHSILKVITNLKDQPIDLSRKQLQRIIHNFSHYLANQEKEGEFQQLCSTTFCMGLDTFENDEHRMFYRRIFEAVILSVRNNYACNSMVVVEILRTTIAQNLNSVGRQNMFPWNRVKNLMEQSPNQFMDDQNFYFNTKSPAFELFVKQLGSLIRVQKVVMVHIFQTLRKRRSLMDLLRRQLPKTTAHLSDCLKLIMDSCSEAVMKGNKHLEEIFKVEIELILKCLEAMIQDEGRAYFSEEVACFLIKFVGRILVEVPSLENSIMSIAIQLLHLDTLVKEMNNPRWPADRSHILRKRPELLEQIGKSELPVFREIYPTLDGIINRKNHLLNARSDVLSLKGGFWIDWLEIWLNDRQLVMDSTLVHASKLLICLLPESSYKFWEGFDSNEFRNIKQLIVKLYGRVDTHYNLVMKILEELLSGDNRVFVRQVFNSMGKLFHGNDNRRESPIKTLSNLSSNAAAYKESFLGFILQVLMLEPWQVTLLDPQLDHFGGTLSYLVNSLCMNTQWKSPHTYINLIKAINKLLAQSSTFPAMIAAMLNQPNTTVLGGNSYPCFDFLFLLEKQLTSKTSVHLSLLSALNEHLDLILMLHETGHLNSTNERETNWLSTLLEYLSIRENRLISLKDIYIIMLHLPDIRDRSISALLRRELDKVTEQDLMKFLIPTSNQSLFGALYINSTLASFMFRGGQSQELGALIDSLKILKQGLVLLADKQTASEKNWNDISIMSIIRDNLLENTGKNISTRPHLLVILANLIVLDKSSLYLINLRHEDVSLLASKVISSVLYLSEEKNRLNRVLFKTQTFKRDVMMYGDGNTLRSLMFQALDDKLKQEHASSIDTLVFLAMLIDKEPELVYDIILALQLRIETTILLSLDIRQERRFEVGLGFLLTISSNSPIRKMFTNLFSTDFLFQGLIRICTTLALRKSRSSVFLLTTLCNLLVRELPNNTMVEKVVASNFCQLVNPQLVASIISGQYQLFGNSSKPNSVNWADDSLLISQNQRQLAGLLPPNRGIIKSMCVENWCKFCLIALQSNLEERDHIALVIQPNSKIIQSSMKQLAGGLWRVGYPEPAIALLATTIDKLKDQELAAFVVPIVEDMLQKNTNSDRVMYSSKMLLLTIKKYASTQSPNFRQKLSALLAKTENVELLLLLACETANTPTSPPSVLQNQALTDQNMRLLLCYIGESNSTCIEKMVLPIQEMIASLQNKKSWNLNYFFQMCVLIHQIANSTIPTYESGNRSSMHIVWCWCLLLARQMVIDEQISKEALDKLEEAVKARIQIIVSYNEKKEYSSTPLIQERSIAFLEELNLLMSATMALLSKGKMKSSCELLYKLSLLVIGISQSIQPFSRYEEMAAQLSPSVNPPTTQYSMLDLAADSLEIELLQYYIGLILLMLQSNQPIPLDFIKSFEITLPQLMDRPTNILYRVGSNRPSVEALIQNPPQAYIENSKAIGYLNTTQPQYSYTEFMNLSNCIIHNMVEVVSSYLKLQLQTSQPQASLTTYSQQFYQAVLGISSKYQNVFPQNFLDKLSNSMQAALQS